MCQSHSMRCLSWLENSDRSMSWGITFAVNQLVKHKKDLSSLSLVNLICQDSFRPRPQGRQTFILYKFPGSSESNSSHSVILAGDIATMATEVYSCNIAIWTQTLCLNPR